MSLQSIVIKNLSVGNFALSIQVGSKRVISHIFHGVNDTFDVTGLATIDELNGNSDFIRLVNTGVLSVNVSNGTNLAPVIQEYTSIITLAQLQTLSDVGLGALLLPALPANVFILGTAFSLLEVLTGGPTDVTIFVGSVAVDHDLMEERQMVSGKVANFLYTGAMNRTTPYCPGVPNGSTSRYVPQVSFESGGGGLFANLTAGRVKIHIYYLQVF